MFRICLTLFSGCDILKQWKYVASTTCPAYGHKAGAGASQDMAQTAIRALLANGIWLGVLDILVVAYLIYRLLLLARGTRALQILGGLGTLLLALTLSARLHLDTLNWLLNLIVPLGPVAIV